MTIRVVVAEDDALVRAGITMLLEAQPDLEVVAQAADGEEAVRRTREADADVVLMDVRMPRMDGIEATRILVTEPADDDRLAKVLMLTTFDADDAVHRALQAGASGYMLKHATAEKLVEAVRIVAAGGGWIDPDVVSTVLAALREVPHQTNASSVLVNRLSKREREVLSLMAIGMSAGEIAQHWVLSEATVKTHISRILIKTGSRDRTQAVVLAYQSGLVVAPPRSGHS